MSDNGSFIKITEPAAEPVTLAEAKVWCRVTANDEDDRITLLSKDARQRIEARTQRSLITQTWELVLDAFPATVDVRLWYGPIQSPPVSVKYLDTAGAEQSFDLNNVVLDSETSPGWVRPAYGLEWPDTLASANAVRIRFKAGYGDVGSNVPETLRSRILQLTALLYEQREPPEEFWCALDPFIVYG